MIQLHESKNAEKNKRQRFPKPHDDLPGFAPRRGECSLPVAISSTGPVRRSLGYAEPPGRELIGIKRCGLANWATGEQALANVTRLMDMARRAEQGGLISFRAFVDWLDDQAENGGEVGKQGEKSFHRGWVKGG